MRADPGQHFTRQGILPKVGVPVRSSGCLESSRPLWMCCNTCSCARALCCSRDVACGSGAPLMRQEAFLSWATRQSCLHSCAMSRKGVGRNAGSTQTPCESRVLQPIQGKGQLKHRTIYITFWCIRTALAQQGMMEACNDLCARTGNEVWQSVGTLEVRRPTGCDRYMVREESMCITALSPRVQ